MTNEVTQKTTSDEQNVSSSNGLEVYPKLRFKNASGQAYTEWKKNKLVNFVSPRVEKQTPTKDAPLMAFTAENGVTDKGERYDRSFLVKSDDKLYKRTEFNDFIYSSNNLDVGSIGLNKFGTAVISDVYEIFKVNDKAMPDFVSELIQRPYTLSRILRYRQGCLYGQYKIYADDFLSVDVFAPSLDEQRKINNFLTAIDARIEKQRQLVEALKKYKRGLLSAIFDHISGNEKTTLGSICNITTGKLDANAMVDGGAYRFYTCAKEYFQIDTYAFDTDALLISGNGANVGYIHHYNGKFNAYQRTYVLDSFKKNIMYIYYYLEAKLHPRIEAEKKAGNTPYIVLSTLSDMEIIVPNPTKQESIAQLLCKFDKFIKAESYTLELYQKQKDGLLQQMFI